MIVYIEDCLIENFFVTFLVLKCIIAFFKIRSSNIRIIFASIFGAIIALIYPILHINNYLLIIMKLFVAYLIINIAFNYKNIFAKYVAFIFFTALFAGLNILFYYLIYGSLNVTDNFPTYVLLFLIFLIYYMVIAVVKFASQKLAIANFVYKVKICERGKEITINAFLDSGNSLQDDDLSPILIINQKVFNKLYKDISFSDLLVKNFKHLKQPHYVKSCFASGSAKILVFCVDMVLIATNDKQIEIRNAKLGVSYAKFSKETDCDMLLNICVFS